MEIIEALNTLGLSITKGVLKAKEKPVQYITYESLGMDDFEAYDKAYDTQDKVQINLFSKAGANASKLLENSVKALQQAGFLVRKGPELYEEDTDYFHRVLTVTQEKEEIINE